MRAGLTRFAIPAAIARAIFLAEQACQFLQLFLGGSGMSQVANYRVTNPSEHHMAKPTRTILFLAVDVARAQVAASAFTAASTRLGLSWTAQAHELVSPIDPILPQDVAAVVAIDLPDFVLPEGGIRLERIVSAPDLEQSVNGLIARLLGGSDSPQSKKPSLPTPSPSKKIHTVKVSRETAGRRGRGLR